MTAVNSLLEQLRHLGGQSVAVVGCGRAGAAAASLLVRLGAEVVVLDDAGEDRVKGALRGAGVSVDAVQLRCGGLSVEGLEGSCLVVLSPGVPRAHALVREALSRGLPVVSELELAAAQLHRPVVAAITGTNGKSTTTSMLGAIMRQVDDGVFVGGNLGVPLSEAVARGERPRTLILELSSYQLETLSALDVRVAVVTNLSPDHLDRYGDDEDAYYAAKARIFELVEPRGTVCLNRGDVLSRGKLHPPVALQRFDFDVPEGEAGAQVQESLLTVRLDDEVTRVPLMNPRIVGHHNRQNAAAAVVAAAALGVPSARWGEGLERYPGIPHRLEFLGEVDGVRWFNDSKATNVDASIKAVESFERGVHLIAGGQGKGASYAPLVQAARGRVCAVYTVGEDAPKVGAAFAGAAEVVAAGTLDAAVAAVKARAQAGDVLLLAPACASFDQFESYAARGEQLRALFQAAALEGGAQGGASRLLHPGR